MRQTCAAVGGWARLAAGSVHLSTGVGAGLVIHISRDRAATSGIQPNGKGMGTFRLAGELLTTGTNAGELAKLRRTGGLVRVRRGAYAEPDERDYREWHRMQIASTLEYSDGNSVVSFASAALLHGLPIWRNAVQRVHLTRKRVSGGQRRSVVHLHVADLGPDDVTEIDGMPVTSLARTLVDHARTVPLGQAVAAGDQAVRKILAFADGNQRVAVLSQEIDLQLESAKNRRGIGGARYATTLLDGASESPGESISRVGFVQRGLPMPELQAEIWADGVFLARVDFLWREFGTVGEFDGKIKYGRLLREGESPADVVYREKIREDQLRDVPLQVARWIWPEAAQVNPMVERVERNLRRGVPYHGDEPITSNIRARYSQPRYL